MPVEIELLDPTGDVMGRNVAEKKTITFTGIVRFIYHAEILITHPGTIHLCVIYDAKLPGGYAAMQCPWDKEGMPPTLKQGDNFTFNGTVNFVRDDDAK